MYFDSSIYAFTDDRGDVDGVKTWLRGRGFELLASDEANVGEALDLTGPSLERRLRTIRTLADLVPVPSDLAMSKEVLSEIVRCRPDWISKYPSVKDTRRYLAHRRKAGWQAVMADPTRFKVAVTPQLEAIRRVLADNQRLQAERRRQTLKGGRLWVAVRSNPAAQEHLERLPKPELVWRTQMYFDYGLLFSDPVSDSAETEWLLPALDRSAFEKDGSRTWTEFWVFQADPVRMPVNSLYVAGMSCQDELIEKGKVTEGHTVDRIHMTYLAFCDYVLTTDEGMYGAMQCAIQKAPHRGEPLLLQRSASSVVAELNRVLPR